MAEIYLFEESQRLKYHKREMEEIFTKPGHLYHIELGGLIN